MAQTIIIKRKGHEEAFDDRKLYGSIYAAALTAHYNEHASEEIATDVTNEVTAWLMAHANISSNDLKTKVHSILMREDKEVAFLYESHLDIC